MKRLSNRGFTLTEIDRIPELQNGRTIKCPHDEMYRSSLHKFFINFIIGVPYVKNDIKRTITSRSSAAVTATILNALKTGY